LVRLRDWFRVERCQNRLEGDPAERISALASEIDADLIVTGSRPSTFLGSLLSQHKAPQIMHRAPLSYFDLIIRRNLRSEPFQIVLQSAGQLSAGYSSYFHPQHQAIHEKILGQWVNAVYL
jgi:hypothetical protein